MSYKVIQRAITCTITLKNKYMLQRETGNQKKKKRLSDGGRRSTMTPCLLIPLGSAIFHFSFWFIFSVVQALAMALLLFTCIWSHRTKRKAFKTTKDCR